jgi:putative ABC transport system permease protein
MITMKKILSTIRNLFRHENVERDLDAEVRSYADLLQEERMSNGMDVHDAKRSARMNMGGPEQLKEEIRSARAGAWVGTLWQDLRFGIRTLAKKPGFTAVAVLSLALGTGAATAIFTLVDRVLLQPLPYRDSGQLVWMTEQTTSANSTGVSWPNYQDWKQLNRAFTAMAGYRDAGFPMAEDGFSGLVSARYVTERYFDLMEISPLLGRTFQPGENTPGGPQHAVLSYEYWRDRYGNSPQVLGKVIRLGSKSFTIIGVMPQGFGAVTHTAFWLPFEQNVPKLYLTGRDVAWLLYIVGRCAPGVSFDAARLDMARVGDVLARQYPAVDTNSRPMLKDLDRYMLGDNRSVLILVATAVCLLLLITFANVASLLLVKTSARKKEFSLRLALGARRTRVFRQILTEGFLLASIGGILGFVIAWMGIRLAVNVLPRNLPLAGPLAVDLRALAFTLGVTIFTSFVIGFAPARFAMRSDPQSVLRSTSHQIRGGHKRLHGALIICEIGLAMAVLVGTGLLVRTMRSLLSTDLGFDSSHLVTATVSMPAAAYPDTPQQAAFIQHGIDRIKTIPGVLSASAIFPVPFSPQVYQVWLAIEGRTSQPGIEQSTFVSVVSFGYLDAMKIPILEGRDFLEQDTQPNIRSVVIDRGLAARYFPNESPIGKSIKLFTENFSDASQPSYTVVGIAGAVRAASLDENPPPRVYVLMQQLSTAWTFVVRTSKAPLSVQRTIQDELRTLDRSVPVFNVAIMEDTIHSSQKSRTQAMWLLISFSGAALILAALGLYGVMSYLVGQRTNEIGIRMALGAHPRDIRKLIFGYGAALVAGGAVVGLASALVLGRLMRTLLYQVQPPDGLTIAVVTAVIVAVAWVACYVPARRAMKVDPMIALRYE